MNKRINYLDIIKTVSIFLIVFVHYPWISRSVGSNVSMLVTIIGVPLFFMVNGALLLNQELSLKKHFAKIKHFFISIIVLKLLILGICLITKRISITEYGFIDIFLYTFTWHDLKNIPAEHLWFMFALLKIYIIYPLIYIWFKKDKKYLKYIFIFCLVFGFGFELLNDISTILNKFAGIPIISFNGFIESYSPLTDICQYLTYFILGYYLHNRIKDKPISRKECIILIISYIFGLFLIFVSRYIQTGYMLTGPYHRVLNDYSKLGDLIMSCSIFLVASKIKLKKYGFFNYIGSRTLNIYYVHMIILAYAYTYIYPHFSKYAGMKINFIRTIIVIAISIGITELLKRIPLIKKIFS